MKGTRNKTDWKVLLK